MTSLDRTFLAFLFVLAFPSLYTAQRFLGTAGVAAYVIAVTLLLLLFRRHGAVIAAKVTERQATWLLAGTLLLLVLAFALLYPLADAGIVGGGSDSDDALNLATTELLHGRYPYYPRTYLNKPISPLPGSLLLAVPFVLLGNGAYQTFFWLALFLLFARRHFGSAKSALFLLWAMLALSPDLLRGIVVGSDLLANSIYVVLFTLWLCRPHRSPWRRLGAAVLLGIGLATRAHFLLILPLVFAFLVRQSGWRVAVSALAVTTGTVVGLILPFFLYDPAGFSPLYTAGKLGQFGPTLPWAGVVIPLLGGLLALVLALRPLPDVSALLRAATAVVAFPVVCAVFLSLIQFERPDFWLASYGVSFLFMGAWAVWPAFSASVFRGPLPAGAPRPPVPGAAKR